MAATEYKLTVQQYDSLLYALKRFTYEKRSGDPTLSDDQFYAYVATLLDPSITPNVVTTVGPGLVLDDGDLSIDPATFPVVGAAGIPAPALVATSNITLSGNQVVDGVATNTLAAGSYVLATEQTTSANKGPWVVNNSGAWTQPVWYDSDADVAAARGITTGAVLGGNLAGSVWFQSSGTTLAGAKTWTKLSTPSLLQDTLGTTLPAQLLTQHIGVASIRDPVNGRNKLDYGRADPREYGAVASNAETTGTFTAGSPNAPLADGSTYPNGCWLLAAQSGPAHGMATPGAPTAIVQGVTGATTWEFQLVAMTSSYGYTAASPITTVSNANAVLSEDVLTVVLGVETGRVAGNYIDLFPSTDVDGAMWYLVYARKSGVGNLVFYGAMLAHPHPYSEDQAPIFRFMGNARGLPSGIPANPPVAAVPNALRTQVKTGGGTNNVTISPVPYNSASGKVVEHCNVIPHDDAMYALSGGTFGARQGGLIAWAPGTYPMTGDVRITRSHTERGAHKGKGSATVIWQMKHGAQVAVDAGCMAPMRQPGTLYRRGDRVQCTIHGRNGANFTTVFYCADVTSVDGTWGASAPGADPAWNFTDGASTADGEITWKANAGPSGAFYTDAFDAHISGIRAFWIGSNGIPSGRFMQPRNLRQHWRGVANPGTGFNWQTGIPVSAGQYVCPSNPKANGFMFRAGGNGTTHATTEPTWPRHVGDTVGDNGITWTCYPKPMAQGCGVLLSVPSDVHIAVDGVCGSGLVMCGDVYHGYNTDWSDIVADTQNCWQGHGVVAYGSDGECSNIRARTKATSGGCSILDDSFYGNKWDVLCKDGAAIIQNSTKSGNPQYCGFLLAAYTEGGTVDWNAPSGLQGGVVATQFVGSAIYNGISAVDSGRRLDVQAPAPYQGCLNITGGYLGLESTAGVKGSPWTYYQSRAAYNLGTTFKRIQSGLNALNGSLTLPTEEEPQYDGRGFSRCYPPGLRAGGGRYAGDERFYLPVSAVPTVGAFAPGDWLPWAADSRRLAIIATRRGAEGYTARVNSFAYAQGQIVASASGGRLFVCCNGIGIGGNSAAAEPAGMATAAIDTYVNDGVLLWQCVGIVQQSAQLLAVPNWGALPVALPDSNAAVDITGGSVRNCSAFTANRSPALALTGAIAGDGMRFENMSAFTCSLPADGGTIVLPAKSWVELTMNAGATAWHQSRYGVYL